MTAISTLPLNPVTSTTIDFSTLLGQAGDQPEEPYPVYQFAGGRKTFWSNMQDGGIYDKPVAFVDGKIIHLVDPDLI